MSSWDVFQGDSLELQRSLSTRQVQAALAAGDLRDDDLARPAGTKAPWLPIAQIGEFSIPGRTTQAPPTPQSPAPPTDRPPAPSPAPPPPQASPESLARTVPLPDWFELGTEDDDVSFPVISDPAAAGSTPQPVAEDVPQVESSAEFQLAPAEPTPPIPTATGWIWDDDDADDDEEPEETVDQSGGPSAPFMASPANPAETWDLGPYDLAPDLGQREPKTDKEEPSSRIALPIIQERSSQIALPIVASRDWSEPAAVEEAEGESEEEVFTFARRSANKIEELDLAPMVDVAFQLVLFFMVTATTVLYKTLEVPKPSGEKPPDAVVQGKTKSVDDLRDDYIVVEIDPAGSFKIDREPVVADMETLVERLRTSRDKTARRTMLLSAEYATPHRFAVLAIDAANEIGLGIAVARPQGKQAPAPALFPLNPQDQPKAKAAGNGG